MATTIPTSPDNLPRLLTGYPTAVVVLVAYFLLATASVRETPNTFDEIAHITAGYSYWTRNDFRLHPTNGSLLQRWFAMPLLTLDLKFPENSDAWNGSNVWGVARQFFFESGNDADRLLWRARHMNAILAVALGLLVYAWSRRLFGPSGGMVSVLAYATNPGILANGVLATSDLAAALFFAASVGCLWKMFHRVSPGNFACTWLALTLLVLSKMSAGLVIPMAVVLLILRLLESCSLTVGWKNGVAVERRWAQALVLTGTLLLQAVFVVAAIWTSYGFRYSAFHEPHSGKEYLDPSWNSVLDGSGRIGQVVEFVRDHHLLPEAYIYGNAHIWQDGQMWPSFLNGQWSTNGWWYFFPYTFLVKSPLPLLALLILAGSGAIWSWRQSATEGWHIMWQSARDGFFVTAPLWVVLAVYGAAAIHTKLNIGHRHILPLYPPLFIFLGATAHWLRSDGRLRQRMSTAVAICLVALGAESLAQYPYYLAYFNQLVGGQSNAYKHLADSSLDWGQDLCRLRRWLEERHLDAPGKTSVYLGYFGTASLPYYHVPVTRLPSSSHRPGALFPLTAGVYCLSATYLQQVYEPLAGPWCAANEKEYQEKGQAIEQLQAADPATRTEMVQSKGKPFWDSTATRYDLLRVARLCAFLRPREPDDNVGYSILIYRLRERDIREALEGTRWFSPRKRDERLPEAR